MNNNNNNTKKYPKSEKLFAQAQKIIPGGVNSPVRAFKSVGGNPIYIERGENAFLIDADNNKYLDFCSSWGPLLFGHAHKKIIKNVQKATISGLSFGACNSKEVEMAKLLTKLVPSMEMVRMVNSGTEATMTALRLARGYTNRAKIVKFDGCYHGHADYLLVSAGSGLLTGGISSSAGVNDSAIQEVIVLPYNDFDAVKKCFTKFGKEIAAVIIEPIAGNMGLILPQKNFLKLLREETQKAKSLLIFDEVITGFRLAPTTYGEMIGVKPDLTCLGKIVGGGMPMAAFGGKKEIMEHLAPLGNVYQAGTLSGNPIALTAGITMLQMAEKINPYAKMEKLAKKIEQSVNKLNLPVFCERIGGLFTIYFMAEKKSPKNLEDVQKCDTKKFAKFHREMLSRGFYLSPSQFELGFISAVQTEKQIDDFIENLNDVLPKLF